MKSAEFENDFTIQIFDSSFYIHLIQFQHSFFSFSTFYLNIPSMATADTQ